VPQAIASCLRGGGSVQLSGRFPVDPATTSWTATPVGQLHRNRKWALPLAFFFGSRSFNRLGRWASDDQLGSRAGSGWRDGPRRHSPLLAGGPPYFVTQHARITPMARPPRIGRIFSREPSGGGGSDGPAAGDPKALGFGHPSRSGHMRAAREHPRSQPGFTLECAGRNRRCSPMAKPDWPGSGDPVGQAGRRGSFKPRPRTLPGYTRNRLTAAAFDDDGCLSHRRLSALLDWPNGYLTITLCPFFDRKSRC